MKTSVKTLVRHDARHRVHSDRVVRIHLPLAVKTYSYICGGKPRLGSLVRVHTPISGTVVSQVVGMGRNGYAGPLKRATLVHR